jgi:tetratricopeptide (TPR) repeat protein
MNCTGGCFVWSVVFGKMRRIALLLLAATPNFAAPAVTFYRNIAPIVYHSCAPCHRPGEPGPFPLLTYQDVSKRGRQIVTVIKSHYMPPWLPEPGYGDFQDQRRLSDEQIQLIEQWVSEGAPAGSPADAPPRPHFTPGWQLGTPDLVLHASAPYHLPASGPDNYWNFVLPMNLPGTRWVKAIEIRPGNTRAVHHANALVDRSGASLAEEKTPGSGFPGMDLSIESDTFDPDSHFMFWKPGGMPWVEPDGMAWRADPGNYLVLNVHMQTTGKPELVQPSVGLYFTDHPGTRYPMLIQLENDSALDIPPGDPDFLIKDDFTVPMDLDVLGVYPHAHYLGHLLEGYATLPNGRRQWLLRIPNWDVNWQAVYRYKTPVFLPKGTVISMRYHYDNSAHNPRNPNQPPKRVRGGNQATDEMGHLWLQVLPRGGRDRRMELQEALMRHRLDKYPGDYLAQFNLGALMLARGKPADGIPLLRAAVASRPDQSVALNTLGAALLETGHASEATAMFERALAANPRYTNARYNLANALAEQQQWAPAAAQFRKVLEENPADEGAQRHLAEVLQAEGPGSPPAPDPYQAGIQAYSRRQYAEAIVWFEKAASGPHGLVAQFMAGNAGLAAHLEERARQAFAAVFQVAPDSAAARLLTAQMMLRARQEQAAVQEVTHALQLDPRLPQAHYLLGEDALARGDAARAAAEFQKEIEINPGFAMAYYRLGDACTRSGDWTQAIASLERSVWLDPNSTGPYVLLGKAYMHQGRGADGEAALHHALAMDPRNREAQAALQAGPSEPPAKEPPPAKPAAPLDPSYVQGVDSYHRHDYLAASQSLQQAVASMPAVSVQYQETLEMIGRSEYLAGHKAAAIPWLEKARAAGRHSAELSFVLGNCYLQQQQMAKARAALAATFGVPADSPAARLFTAQMLIRMEMEDEALREIQDSQLPGAHFMLGEIAIYHAQIDRATRELQHEIALNPDFAMAYYRLGDAYTRREQWDAAIPPLQRAIWLNPTYSGPYILLGKACWKTGDFAEAERLLRLALQMDPRNASAHYILGRTLIQAGHAEEGKKVLERWEALRQDAAAKTSP